MKVFGEGFKCRFSNVGFQRRFGNIGSSGIEVDVCLLGEEIDKAG